MAKRKHKEEAHEEHADETWLIPYSDLLTLLLALFIVLFASSTLDKKKASQIESAFAAAFNSLPPEQMNGTLINFLDDIQGLDLGKDIILGTDSRGVIIEIADIAMFEHGSINIKPQIIPILKKISNLLEEPRYKKFRIVVEGHTDDLQAEGFHSNWELSSMRSSAVVNELINSGLDSNRFQVVGMSGIAPKYPNLDSFGEPIPGNREKNRRVVIRIEPY